MGCGNKNTTALTRRQFTSWLSMAGAAMTAAQPGVAQEIVEPIDPILEEWWNQPSSSVVASNDKSERWNKKFNDAWSWYEREKLTDHGWVLTGITTPWNRSTGEKLPESMGYLDESLVPIHLRHTDQPMERGSMAADAVDENHPGSFGQVSMERQMRDGRPPSLWLRSMQTDELRVWLAQVDVPEAGVAGMTYWVHLTRDHRFHPLLIKGLTVVEQAKLHGAAHHGY